MYAFLRTALPVFVVTAALAGCAPSGEWPTGASSATAQPQTPPGVLKPGTVPAAVKETGRNLPSLLVTDEPAPDVIYRRGARDTVLAPDSGDGKSSLFADTRGIETPVTRKAQELKQELKQLQASLDSSASQWRRIQLKNDTGAAEYYALVAAISTELQSGTTSGNPILLDRWNVAQKKLNALAQSSSTLSNLANDLSNQASRSAYLLEQTQAAFALSGAVKEDHKKLTAVEDGANQNITAVSRLLVSVNDEIARREAYLKTERANLQTLSLGIAKGELYGQNLSNPLFRKAAGGSLGSFKSSSSEASPSSDGAPSPSTRRPLVIIRFDRPNVNYNEPLYAAVSQTLEKYPAAKFDLVAVGTAGGNAAQTALSSVQARKNGEAVLRSLIQMGLPIERIRLSAATSKNVVNSEVHLYLQ